MDAVILAAGRGRRLKENTDTIPKALIKIHGKPILYYQLEAIRKNKIKKVIIVVGYRGEKIRQYLRNNFKDIRIILVENEDYRDTNSAYSFYLAHPFIETEFYLHFNCDVLFSPELLRQLIHSPQKNIIILDEKIRLRDNMEQVLINRKNRIIHMQNTLLKGAIGKAAGIAKFHRDNIDWMVNRIVKYLKIGKRDMNFYAIIREAVKVRSFYVLKNNDPWLMEINTSGDLREAKKKLSTIPG